MSTSPVAARLAVTRRCACKQRYSDPHLCARQQSRHKRRLLEGSLVVTLALCLDIVGARGFVCSQGCTMPARHRRLAAPCQQTICSNRFGASSLLETRGGSMPASGVLNDADDATRSLPFAHMRARRRTRPPASPACSVPTGQCDSRKRWRERRFSRARAPALWMFVNGRAASVDAGHVFVVHADLRALSCDAALVPTRNVANRKWFPAGPPEGTRAQWCAKDFTDEFRVRKLLELQRDKPTLWLGHVDGRFAPPEAVDPLTGRPGLEWFLAAAEQFLHDASAGLSESSRPPRCGREKYLLALPVLGTGRGGARKSSGKMISRLLQLLHAFVDTHKNVDVALVVKSDRMFSAAQACRRQLPALGSRWEKVLGLRLSEAAAELAALAKTDQLSFFLGAGVSLGAGLPDWQDLVVALARREEIGLSEAETAQLQTLDLADQASVLAARLETLHRDAASPSTGALSGEQRLQQLVVAELSVAHYSLAQGLLAGLPVAGVVTTNYDNLFEAAWRGAGARFSVLPYETDTSERFVLKLHGDLRQPEDIVLTRSQMTDNRERRRALSGIVQAMLMTKHLLFVGFSLQDPNFSEVAGTVRQSLPAVPDLPRRDRHLDASRRLVARPVGCFGTLLSLHNRPFLSELWPDVRCLPMDTIDATKDDAWPRARCARVLDIFLDKLSLDASMTTRHLLDPDFAGEFTQDELALKHVLLNFTTRLELNGAAQRSAGFATVLETLKKLGHPHPADAQRLADEDK